MTDIGDLIRGIACHLAGRPASDYEITAVASKSGCECPVSDNIDTLEFMSRFVLGKYMVAEGKKAGLTIEAMGRLTAPRATTSTARH